MNEKIVIIGAGGRGFSEAVIADLIRMQWACELVLVDIDPEALDVIERLATRMLAERPAPITIQATCDRREALPDATVVIVTINVGGRGAWTQDVLIPREFGIYAPVGDTVGPGGASRGLRMIPVVVDIARDVVEQAPDVLFINYANPMAPICRAVRRETGLAAIGLCHGIIGDGVKHLSRMLQVPMASIQHRAAGYNHLTWFTELRIDGQDATPMLKAFAAEHVARALRAVDEQSGIDPRDAVFSWQLFQVFGHFPCVLDRHVTEFFPQFFADGTYYGRTLGVDAFSFEGTIASGDGEYATMRDRAYSDAPLGDGYFAWLEREHELVMDIVADIRGDARGVYYANLPNTGQIPNLPEGVIVESLAVADAFGIRAIAQDPLPASILGTLERWYRWAETVIDAALTGDRNAFIQALILDGSCDSMATATALADALLTAQAAHLPRFVQAEQPAGSAR